VFVQSKCDNDGVLSSMMTSGAMDSKGRVKCMSLEDSGSIVSGNVACGRHHIMAVKASTEGALHVPRVFT